MGTYFSSLPREIFASRAVILTFGPPSAWTVTFTLFCGARYCWFCMVTAAVRRCAETYFRVISTRPDWTLAWVADFQRRKILRYLAARARVRGGRRVSPATWGRVRRARLPEVTVKVTATSRCAGSRSTLATTPAR